MLQGGDDTGLQTTLSNEKIAVAAVYHVDQRTIIRELATLYQTLEHDLPMLILDRDTAIAEFIKGAQNDLIGAQGLIQQQVDIFQYDHHSLVENKGCLSMTVGRSKKFDLVHFVQRALALPIQGNFDGFAKLGTLDVNEIIFQDLSEGFRT